MASIYLFTFHGLEQSCTSAAKEPLFKEDSLPSEEPNKTSAERPVRSVGFQKWMNPRKNGDAFYFMLLKYIYNI